MAIVNFEGYRVHIIKFENFIMHGQVDLNLAHVIKTKVDYNSEQNKCVCYYNIDIKDKDEKQPFSITVQISGLFSYDPTADQKAVHVEAARQLFPYLRTTVSSVTTAAGLPPLVIPDHTISADTIFDAADTADGINPGTIRS